MRGLPMAMIPGLLLMAFGLALETFVPAAADTDTTVPLQAVSACVVTTTKHAAPANVRTGEPVTVSLGLEVDCPPQSAGPLAVALVLDASRSMAGPGTEAMKNGARQLVQGLGMGSGPSTLVGVVQYSNVARALCDLTEHESVALQCINRVSANGGSDIAAGMQEGTKVLSTYYRRLPPPARGRSVMFVFSDGSQGGAGCKPMLEAAARARSMGITIASACLGTSCDHACMRAVASDPTLFFAAGAPIEVDALFARVLEAVTRIRRLASVVVTDFVSPGVFLLPDSALPRAEALPGPPATLRWQLPYIPPGGTTLAFRVTALRPGTHLADDLAEGRLDDGAGASRTWSFPPATFTAAGPVLPPPTPVPAPSATATPPSPAPRDTPTPGAPGIPPYIVCDVIRLSAPPAAIAGAMANPSLVTGYGHLCQPSAPAGPWNVVRTSLSLQNAARAYHPVFNSLVWKCGCP